MHLLWQLLLYVLLLSVSDYVVLTFSQVERGYYMHRSGDLTSTANEFSTTNWIKATNFYLGKIGKFTDASWREIFEALYHVQETRTHETQNEVGAVVEEEHEPFLPEDPPTPPPI